MAVLDVGLQLFFLAIFAHAVQTWATPPDRGSDDQEAKPQPRPVSLKVARQLAAELDATLVRRRDGSYYMKVGPVQSQVPLGNGNGIPIPPRPLSPSTYTDPSQMAAQAWLSMMADSLDAELLYDGKSGEWYLNWSQIQEETEGD